MSDDIIAVMALQWITAEREARGEDSTLGTTSDDIAIASDHVYNVLAGNVRWSDAGPGDRAIWRGRFRDVEKFDRWWASRSPARASDVTPVDTRDFSDDPYNQQSPQPRRAARQPSVAVPKRHRDRMYANYYDTVVFSDRRIEPGDLDCPGRARVFGPVHIGMPRLCNLVVPGRIQDEFWIDTMYCRTTASVWQLAEIADHVTVALQLHKTIHPTVHLRELVMGIPVKQLLPPQTNFELHVWRHSFPRKIPSIEVSFHLEGILIRDS